MTLTLTRYLQFEAGHFPSPRFVSATATFDDGSTLVRDYWLNDDDCAAVVADEKAGLQAVLDALAVHVTEELDYQARMLAVGADPVEIDLSKLGLVAADVAVPAALAAAKQDAKQAQAAQVAQAAQP